MDPASPTKPFSTQSAAVILGCLTAIAAGIYLLHADLNRAGEAGLGPPAARLEHRESLVRRKNATSFAWSDASPGQPLYRRDSVQTGAGANATIQLNDGSKIELGENSLIVIDDVTAVSLKFLRGSFIMQGSEGEFQVSVTKDGKAERVQLPVSLKEPAPLAGFAVRPGEKQAVRFRWTSQDEKPGVLEVSRSQAFSVRSRITHRLETGQTEQVLELPPGAYHWRVSDQERPLSRVGQFLVGVPRPSQLISPVDGKTLSGYGEEVVIQFRWRRSSGSEEPVPGSHELQIAEDPEFSRVLISKGVAEAEGLIQVGGLGYGRRYWRIQSRYGDLEVSSDPESFQITALARPTLSLMTPVDQKSQESSSAVRFAWTSDAASLEYRWELQSSNGAAVQTSDSFAPVVTWRNPRPGRYRWRVIARKDGDEVARSEWREFSVFEGSPIVLRAPSDQQALTSWDGVPAVDFSWNPDPVAGEEGNTYRLSVARDSGFSELVHRSSIRQSSFTASKGKLPDSQLYWKVEILNETGQLIKTSPVWRFRPGLPPLPSAPTRTLPTSGATFVLLEEDVIPELSWNGVPDAVEYLVSIHRGDEEKTRVSEFRTKARGIRVQGLGAGDYQWTVRGVDRLKRLGEASIPSRISLTYGEPLRAPAVKGEVVQ